MLQVHAVVALCASGHFPFGKLFAMYVCVAILTLRRSRFEIHIEKVRLEIWRLMAIHACCRSMCSQQRELRLGMIEAGQFFPRFRRMTSFASCHRTIPPHHLHSFFELPLVGIVVATGAI